MKKLKYLTEDDWNQDIYQDIETGKNYIHIDGVMYYSSAVWGEPICPVEFEYEIVEPKPENPQRHTYMMLSMYKSRVEFFLDWGKGNVKELKEESIDAHIEEMKSMWNSLVEKPEWLTMKQIDNYHERMKRYIPHDEPVRS
jgi:hypothetical protein